MSSIEIISLVVTVLCLVSFCLAFTFLFRHYYKSETEKVLMGKEDKALLEDIAIDTRRSEDKKRKILSLVGKIAGYVVLAVVGVFFVMTLISRFSSGALFFGDKAYLVIATGSMSEKNKENDYLFDSSLGLDDQFDAYDMIQIQKYESEEDVDLYDVVAYKDKDGTIIVHRIIEIDADGYITRGDANAASDTGVTYDGHLAYKDILGRYDGSRIKGIGSIIVFLQSNAGIITIASILYCFLMFDYFSSRYDKAIERRKTYLLKRVPFDPNDENDLEKLDNSFKQTLTYKDKEYDLLPLAGEESKEDTEQTENDPEREDEKK